MFSVVQFNIQYGQVWDSAAPDDAPFRIGDVIEALRAHDADVLLLQEVEQAGPRGRRPDPARNLLALQAAFPDRHVFFDFPPFDERELPFGIGLAILSRRPLHDTLSRPLPAADVPFTFRGETTQPTQRLLIGATTADAEGRPVRVLNTHLQAYFMIDASSDDHPEQRQIVLSTLRASRIPALVGGDFNAAPGENLVAEFEGAGFRAVQKTVPTWKRRPYVTDHIFFNTGLRLVRSEVVPTLASDHDILRAEFEVRG